MKFYDYPDSFVAARKAGLDKIFGFSTRTEMHNVFQRIQKNPLGLRHANFDMAWDTNGRPYYDVYPSIIPLLIRLNLDIPGISISKTDVTEYVEQEAPSLEFLVNNSHGLSPVQMMKQIEKDFHFPKLPHLLIRLPERKHILTYNDPKFGTTPIRTIFISFQPVNKKIGEDKQTVGMVIGIDVGERDETQSLPMHTMQVFPLDERPVEEVINSLPNHSTSTEGMQIPHDLMMKCVKLAITLRLLDEDEDLIEPDVLTKDRRRYIEGDEELKKQLIAKAKRRGKFGFVVGSKIESGEMDPHYRRPHPALVWTIKRKGVEGSIPKVILRSGSVIHKDKVKTVPTGYQDVKPLT